MGGITPISWFELKSFDFCGKLDLKAWEFTQLMSMSKSYCEWNSKGRMQKDIPDDVPYIDETKNAAEYLNRQREASAKNQRL